MIQTGSATCSQGSAICTAAEQSAASAAAPAPQSWDREQRRQAFLFLAVVAGTLVFANANYPLMKFDEGSYAEVARGMFRSGDWLVPRLCESTYLQKPPLTYWMMAAGFALFGVHDWVARLAPQVATIAAILSLYGLGRRSVGDRAALVGAILLAVSPGFLMLGRKILCDPPLAACVTMAWLLAAAASAIPGALERRRWYASALCCGLGVLAKGPVALALVLPPLAVWCLCGSAAARPQARDWFGYGIASAAVAAPWYLAVAWREPLFAQTFFWRHNIERFLQPFDHQEPWWFYLRFVVAGLGAAAILLPGAVWAAASRRRGWAKERPPAIVLCILLAGWCLAFFSASGCKLPAYILPAAPPACLVVGWFFDRLLDRTSGGWERLRRLLCDRRLAGAVLASGVIATGVVLFVAEIRPWNISSALAVAGLGAVWLGGLAARAERGLRWAAVGLVGLALATHAARYALPDRFSRSVAADLALLERELRDQRVPVLLCESCSPNFAFYLDAPNVRWLRHCPEAGGVSGAGEPRKAVVLSQEPGELPAVAAALPRGATVLRRVQRPGFQLLVVRRATANAAAASPRGPGGVASF